MRKREDIFSNEYSERMFRLLVDDYRNKVVRFVSLFVSDNQSCEEVASDVFVSLWSNWEQLSKISSIEDYIFITAKNKALNHLRKVQKENVDIETIYVDAFYQTQTTPESIYITKEMVAKLNDAINSLPPKTKQAFLLVRENKKTYKDAAKILGVSVGTVEKQVAQAVEKLRERLAKLMKD